MKQIFACIALLLLTVSSAWSQNRDPAAEFTRTNPKFLAAFKESVAKPSQSTVRVFCNGKDAALGMIVGPDGWILTKANDLFGVISVRLRDGTKHDAILVGLHSPHDLALLKIDARNLVAVDFKETKGLEAGSWIACAGLAEEPVAFGVISVPTRNVLNKGPAVDPSKAPYLGVSLETNDGGGVKIQQIVPNTPAAKVGLKANDIILFVAGAKVDNPDQFMQLLGKYKPGETVAFKVRRDKEEYEKSATLEKRPLGSFRGEMQNRMGSELSTRRTGYATILQHDSVLKPTDCGGPIVDLDGRVLGINICRAGRVESWAVPSEIIQPLLLDLMSGKFPPPKNWGDSEAWSLEAKLEVAKAELAKADRDKSRTEKELEQARKTLQSAEAELKTFRVKEGNESADRVLSLMQKRLLVMNEVAGWKWDHRQEILDLAREKDLLIRMQSRAKEQSIDPKFAARFFTAQMEAARLLQQDRIAEWQKANALSGMKSDLGKDLRPKIDQITDELLEAYGKLLRHWKDADLNLSDRVRRQSAKALSGAGINDAVRAKAIEGLLTP